MSEKIYGDAAFRRQGLFGSATENTYSGALSFMRRNYSRDLTDVDVAVPMKTIGGWVIIVTAGMLVLERLGVSGQVLWTAITSFAAVAAVAFFAAWSVLSNIFCAFLIFSTQPFRVGDELEILDASDKVGMHGRVLAIHLLYTVLEEVGRADGRPTLIQVPNSAFFQKTIRRWQSGDGEPSI